MELHHREVADCLELPPPLSIGSRLAASSVLSAPSAAAPPPWALPQGFQGRDHATVTAGHDAGPGPTDRRIGKGDAVGAQRRAPDGFTRCAEQRLLIDTAVS